MEETSRYFIHIIANILEDIVLETEKSINSDRLKCSCSIFNASKLPNISIEQYLYRLMSLSKCEEGSIINALILIDNLCDKNDIFLTRMNYHRILLISVVISVKYTEDIFYSNLFYSKIGGIKLQELNDLEIQFLKLINFRIYTDESDFIKYSNSIKKQINELISIS